MANKGFNRADRVAKLVHHELAKIIQKHSENPNFYRVTVTAVKMSRDLSSAKVFVTVLDDAYKDAVLKNLNKEKSFFRQLLAKQLNLRIVPDLFFLYDDSISYGIKLDALIDQVIGSEQNNN